MALEGRCSLPKPTFNIGPLRLRGISQLSSTYDLSCRLQVEMRCQRRQVIGIMIHVVTAFGRKSIGRIDQVETFARSVTS